NDLKEKTQKYLCQTYARYPLEVKSARGCHLYDFDDQEYLDLLSGISVCNLGHSNPEIIQALKSQADKLIHVSNLFYQEEQAALAEKLTSTCGLDKVFFCNSGAEANEGAIKLVRRYMRKIRKNNKFEVITLSGSFHGRTLATLTATGQDKIKDGFDPLPAGFKTVSFNDSQALENAITPDTAAIMVEIIQGEGGIKILTPEFVKKIKQLCHKHELLFIVDEIQTGLGRTGKFWAHQHFNLDPDIITSAKALANGLPMGAVLAKEHAAKAFDAGSHGTTFGGNPLCCAAALKTLEIIERDKLTERADQLGAKVLKMFEKIKENHPEKIREIRGRGLMLAIDLSFSGNRIWKALLDKKFVLNLTQDTVLRLLPPLIISRDDLQKFAETLDQLLMIPELCGEK
ncbi:MAG: aspartate aminotransferase family protein, partial [Desulfonatronovibrio sp.]